MAKSDMVPNGDERRYRGCWGGGLRLRFRGVEGFEGAVSGAALAVDLGERTDTEGEGEIKLGVGVWTDVAMGAEPSLAGVLR